MVAHHTTGAELMNLRMTLMAMLFALGALLAAPAMAQSDAEKVLYAAYEKMLGTKFSTSAVTTDAKGKQSRASTDFESIERMRIVSDGGSFLILPQGVWMRSSADGEWTKPPFDVSGMLKQLLPRSLSDLRANAKNVRDEGQRTIDGQSLRAITHDLDMKVMGISVSSTTTTFIDADGRIVRSESTGTAMGRKSATVQEVRYDDSIRITAPDA